VVHPCDPLAVDRDRLEVQIGVKVCQLMIIVGICLVYFDKQRACEVPPLIVRAGSFQLYLLFARVLRILAAPCCGKVGDSRSGRELWLRVIVLQRIS